MRLRRFALGLFVACGMLWMPTALYAGDPTEDAEKARELVYKALEAEANGSFVERKKLLSDAITLSEKYAPARWHLGQVLDSDNTWRDVETSVSLHREKRLLEKYEHHRSQLTNSVADHWKLALWCAENRLGQQCAAHLHQVVEQDSNHVGARTALGHLMFAGRWMTIDEQRELEERAWRTRESFLKYGERVSTLLNKMATGSQKISEKARQELLSIKDPLVVATLESRSVGQPQKSVETILESLSAIDDPDASQALVRFALFFPNDSIRRDATLRLKEKPLYDFVPELLVMLSGPMQFSAQPFFDSRGNLLGYRQAFAKEGMNEVQLSLADRDFQRVALQRFDNSLNEFRPPVVNFGSRRLQVDTERAIDAYYNRIVNQMCLAAAARELQAAQQNVARENEQIKSRNESIAKLLSAVADRQFGADSKSAWEWWDSYNETNYQYYKPQRYNYVSLVERIPEYITVAPACECFVRGTLVSTQLGPKPIELIAVGDLVLSRDVESGRICWQAVVAATFQPPKETRTIHLGNEKLTCTSGHLFWVSGEGWKKASEIKSGDWLHGAKEPSLVTEVSESDVLQTYNLEVQDQHTYFVGKSLVLSHDVTPRRASRGLVPGYRKTDDSTAANGKQILTQAQAAVKKP